MRHMLIDSVLVMLDLNDKSNITKTIVYAIGNSLINGIIMAIAMTILHFLV